MTIHTLESSKSPPPPSAPTVKPPAPPGSLGWITSDSRIDWSDTKDTLCPLQIARADPLYGLQGCREWQAEVLRRTARQWRKAAKVLLQKASEIDPHP